MKEKKIIYLILINVYKIEFNYIYVLKQNI